MKVKEVSVRKAIYTQLGLRFYPVFLSYTKELNRSQWYMTYHICVSNVATYAITQTADVISDVPISKIKKNFYKKGEKEIKLLVQH